MKRSLYLLLFIVTGVFSNAFAGSNWVGINQAGQSPAEVRLISSNIYETQLQYSLDGYFEKVLNTPKGKEMMISIDNGVQIMETGYPDLAKIVSTLIIPDIDKMEVNIISSKYVEFENVDVAPSKGHFTRNIRPADVPYVYGEAYQQDAFWPGKLADLQEPFIMRDFRGQSVNVYPFQYNPVTRVLRVYTDLVIEVKSTGKEGHEPLYRTRDMISLEPEFNAIYNRFFLNMGAAEKSYPMLEGEEGSLLIIAHPPFAEAMQPFIDWKRTLGRRTEMVTTATTGTTPTAIKNFVQNYYNNNDDFAYLLLIGDGPQIPPMTYNNNHSDNAYGFLVGTNAFNDIFVGRFSAETVAHVETQVQRMIEYERDLDETDTWLNKGMGIARNEGTGSGHHGEGDHTHMDFIRDTLLNFTYDVVYRNYDGNVPGVPNTTAAQISANINNGVSTINFCNHGSVTSWSVAGYNISHVNQLTNIGKLPYIQSVACVNGAFVNNFCFAEAWMRATHNGQPAGAIGIMAATINQPWQPPMCGQDEMVSIKTEASIPLGPTIKRTYGGISINGSMFMIPQYSTTGINTHATWILFGDPTLMVRTNTPEPFNPIYNPVVFLGTDFFDITIPGADGAVVAVTYYDEVEEEVVILGTATIDGGTATLIFEEPPAEPGMLTLAISGFNRVTYINEELQVIPPEGPYVIFDQYVIDDSQGNNNNQADYGEFITLNMSLKNVGIELAEDVEALLTTESEYVTVIDNHDVWGDIDENDNMMLNGAFTFQVGEIIPDNHNVLFTMQITDAEGHQWDSNFSLRIYSPQFSIGQYYVDDSEHGDGNGRLDAGETADIVITYTNNGGSPAMAPVSSLMAANPYLTIVNQVIEHEIVPAGESIDVAYTVFAHESTVEGTFVDLNFLIEDGHSFSSEQLLIIGQTPEMVLGDGNTPSNQYPFYNYYKANRSQMIYLASELGPGEKTITEIAFEIIQASSSHNELPNFVVRMMHTSASTLSNFLNTAGAPLVYASNPHVMPMATGWHTIELDDYFVYNGSDNLMVEIVWGSLPNWTSNYYRVASTQVSGNRVAYGFNDWNDIPPYNGSSNIRPNLWLTFAAEESDEVQTVEFQVMNSASQPIENALLTIGSMTQHTDHNGFTSYDLLPGSYNFAAHKEGYIPYESMFALGHQDQFIQIYLFTEDETLLPGDANCDGDVNVLDVIQIVNYFLGLNPQPFCYNNADVNQDGQIDVLDVIGTVNIFSQGKATPWPNLRSQTSYIYLTPDGIMLDSDGTLAGLQFELVGNDLKELDFALLLPGHEMAVRHDEDRVSVMVFSLDNKPLPSGIHQLLAFSEENPEIRWGGLIAGNLNALKAPVIASYDYPTGIAETDEQDASGLLVYPNPAKEFIFVQFNKESAGKAYISLSNVHGQTIRQQVISEQGQIDLTLSLEGLKPGFYMLRLDYNDNTIVRKVLVQ
ncbi:MAG: C25 family cysteine peptidase [Bacteroidales bacterium]|nr:C25 family cysteine peptidase [Bacteroidales bacterium]